MHLLSLWRSLNEKTRYLLPSPCTLPLQIQWQNRDRIIIINTPLQKGEAHGSHWLMTVLKYSWENAYRSFWSEDCSLIRPCFYSLELLHREHCSLALSSETYFLFYHFWSVLKRAVENMLFKHFFQPALRTLGPRDLFLFEEPQSLLVQVSGTWSNATPLKTF